MRGSGSLIFTYGYSQSGNTILAGIQKAVEKKKNQPSCCSPESLSGLSAGQRLVLSQYIFVRRK